LVGKHLVDAKCLCCQYFWDEFFGNHQVILANNIGWKAQLLAIFLANIFRTNCDSFQENWMQIAWRLSSDSC
jgi:hypothetical protein